MSQFPSPLAYMRDKVAHAEAVLRENLPHSTSAQDLIALGHTLLEVCETVDSHLQKIAPTPTLACCEGCETCCHNRIEINPIWAFVTLDHAQKTLSDEKLSTVKERLSQEVAFCPFNFDGACSIYEKRPPVCRGYYSFDLKLCLKGQYCEENKGYQGDHAHAAHQNMIFLFVLEERLKALEETLNLQSDPLFLDDAVTTLLQTSDSAQKWLAGETIFPNHH